MDAGDVKLDKANYRTWIRLHGRLNIKTQLWTPADELIRGYNQRRNPRKWIRQFPYMDAIEGGKN
jgi:hypothetical protein